MAADFLTLEGAATLIFFYIYFFKVGSDCLYSLLMDHTPRLRPAGLLGKACHCSDCVSLYEMSLSGMLRRALRSTTCGSPATVPGHMLLYCWILEKSRENVRLTVLTVYSFGCCLAEIVTCVQARIFVCHAVSSR